MTRISMTPHCCSAPRLLSGRQVASLHSAPRRLLPRFSSSLIAIALLLASACGGNPEEAAPFVGTWNYVSGTATASCGGPSQTGSLTGTLTISEGRDSDLVILDGEVCVIKFDVMGPIATARPGQSCDAMEEGVSVHRTISAMTFSRVGETLTLNETSLVRVVADGRTVACSYTRTGLLNRFSK